MMSIQKLLYLIIVISCSVHLDVLFLSSPFILCLGFHIYMSQARKQVQKRNDDTLYFRLKQLIGMDAGGYTDDHWQIVCTCTVVFLPK